MYSHLQSSSDAGFSFLKDVYVSVLMIAVVPLLQKENLNLFKSVYFQLLKGSVLVTSPLSHPVFPIMMPFLVHYVRCLLAKSVCSL